MDYNSTRENSDHEDEKIPLLADITDWKLLEWLSVWHSNHLFELVFDDNSSRGNSDDETESDEDSNSDWTILQWWT